VAVIIDGKKIAEEIREEITKEAAVLKEKGIEPSMGVILVGDDPASHVYVRMKEKACQKAGISIITKRLEASVSQEEVYNEIVNYNNDQSIHGILVQLPLPSHIQESAILEAIAPEKDVDGLHPFNVGKILMGEPVFKPCTPAGIIELLLHTNISISGKHAVIVGRSNIVGKPLAALLMQKRDWGNATVTVCHTGTKNLEEITREADILVAALGVPRRITGDMIKPGAVVIDVGVNRVPDDSAKSGYSLTGDVDFESTEPVAGYITPVPGGVGPMTITMLLRNTLQAAQKIM